MIQLHELPTSSIDNYKRISLLSSDEQTLQEDTPIFKAYFQSSHEAPRSSLRVHA